MTAFIAWGSATLVASAALLLVVLALRTHVSRWIGPRLGYALWALPALRMVLPPLPANMFEILPMAGSGTTGMSVLFTGPRGDLASWDSADMPSLGASLLFVWCIGAIGLFAIYAARHFVFCRRLRAKGTDFGQIGMVRIIATDVEGPLAFGVFRRFIAVPRRFTEDYDARERDLALAHERAHHVRGDLIANWASLVVLAAHWWNPIAWVAIRAFRQDQEFAADANVLAGREASAVPLYARVLAKAAGIGALPACNLNARSNLKGRLMMLVQEPRSSRRLAFGGAALVLFGSTVLAATVTTPGVRASATAEQAVTIGVKPDGAGGYALIVGGTATPPGAALPGGAILPAGFSRAGGCTLKAGAKPSAMVIRGMNGTQTYTVMCASAAPAPVRATLAEGLTSLKTMRASVATQPASPVFPESERAHALGAIDGSIQEVMATLAATN